LFLASQRLFPPVMFGAALPFHLNFFFLGAVSYIIYKRYSGQAWTDTPFPIACCLAIFLVIVGDKARFQLVPVALWITFLGLILEHHSSLSWRIVSSLFTNRIAQRLGRVSYSIYLSHMLLLVVLQHALLRWAPDLSRATHFGILLGLTITATITASVFLYRYVEAPGISVGRVMASRFGRSYQPARVTLEQRRPAVQP
jgi:peptidoglycan/LPS O-acetylase OafA/YrhL